MQQLNQWHLNPELMVIELGVTDLPDLDQMDTISMSLAQTYNFTAVSRELGADRFQLFFRWQAEDYLLCLELLCQSLWIEPVSHKDNRKLAELYKHLGKDTHVSTKHI